MSCYSNTGKSRKREGVRERESVRERVLYYIKTANNTMVQTGTSYSNKGK